MFNIPSFFGFKGAGQFVPSPEYQAILTYAGTLPGMVLPDLDNQYYQNKLILDLIAANLWNKFDCFSVYAIGTGNVEFALIDWKRVIQQNDFNAPSFDPEIGFTGGGTAYIDFLYNPFLTGTPNRVNMGLDDATYGFYMNAPIGTGGYAMGSSILYTRIASGTAANNRINANTGVTGGTQNPAIGYNCMIRNGSNSVVTGRVNGTFTTTGTGGSTAFLTQGTYLLRERGAYSDASIGSSFIASAFDVTEWASFVTIYNNYLSSL
jgi:hypothetical protein